MASSREAPTAHQAVAQSGAAQDGAGGLGSARRLGPGGLGWKNSGWPHTRWKSPHDTEFIACSSSRPPGSARNTGRSLDCGTRPLSAQTKAHLTLNATPPVSRVRRWRENPCRPAADVKSRLLRKGDHTGTDPGDTRPPGDTVTPGRKLCSGETQALQAGSRAGWAPARATQAGVQDPPAPVRQAESKPVPGRPGLCHRRRAVGGSAGA